MMIGYIDNLGRAMVEQQYPSGRVVKNVLNNNGDFAIVQSKKNSVSGFFNYAKSFTYTSAGAISSMQLGNGKWESTIFNSRLQPTRIALGTTQGALDKLQLDYSYGTAANNGNVQSQTITVTRTGQSPLIFNQTYTYDELNRLKTAEEKTGTTTNWKQTFIFDRYGNRRFDQANTTFPSFSNPAVTNPTISTTNNRLTSSGYTFDAAGNTTADAQGRTFVYDAENKQTSVSDGTVGQYFYDGDGRRIKKIVPSTGETTVFVYDAGGKLVAEYSTNLSSPQQVQYLTNDHLGSPRIMTDLDGRPVARTDYMPYGEEIVGLGGRASTEKYVADDVRQGFIGYIKDGETGLDYAQARYFNGGFGRFSSPDPYGGSGYVLIPQSWNRYVYCLNRPLLFTDPSGLIWLTNDSGKNYIWVDDKYYEKNKSKYEGYDVGNGAVIKLGNVTGFGSKYDDLVGSFVSLNSNGTLSASAEPAAVEVSMGNPDEQPTTEGDVAALMLAVKSGRPADELKGPPGGHRRFGPTFRIYDSEGFALLDLDDHSGHEDLGSPHGHWWVWGPNREWANRGRPTTAPDRTIEIGKDADGQPIYEPFSRQGSLGGVVVPPVRARPVPMRPGVPIRPIFPIRIPVFVP